MSFFKYLFKFAVVYFITYVFVLFVGVLTTMALHAFRFEVKYLDYPAFWTGALLFSFFVAFITAASSED